MQDVVIAGGGLAGLSLALQILQRRPETQLAVIDRRSFPVPEAIGKVGESSVEIGAHYFDTVLGLKDYLRQHQLPKLGLRYFLESGKDLQIEQRLEVGNNRFSDTPSYQLDRGRFENYLCQEVIARGGRVIAEAKVSEISLSENATHWVDVSTPAGAQQLKARWVVDASGRAALLRKRLGYSEKSPHQGAAVWWRVNKEVRIDDWCHDETWRRNNQGQHARWFSTNHLMGRGYWVWLIPLASGTTSVGIVVDPEIHPFSEIHTFEKALLWLKRHEPQFADITEGHRNEVMDFGALKNYPHNCQRVFSPQRYALTGEAGLFIDPFYSPGSDLIAISNSYICDLMLRDFAGEAIALRADLYNELYIKLAAATTQVFTGQYTIFGNPLVTPVKLFWDWCFYWTFLARLSFAGKLTDLRFLANARPLFDRFAVLGEAMQLQLRRWDELQRPKATPGFIDFAKHPFLLSLNAALSKHYDDAEFEKHFATGLAQLEAIAAEIAAAFSAATGEAAMAPLATLELSDGAHEFFNPFYRDVQAHLVSTVRPAALAPQVANLSA